MRFSLAWIALFCRGNEKGHFLRARARTGQSGRRRQKRRRFRTTDRIYYGFFFKKKRALIAPFTPCKRARRVADNNLIQPTPSLHQAHYGREKRRDFPYRTRLTLSKLFSSDLYVDSLFYSRTYSELHQVPIDCKLLLSFRHSRMGSLRPDEGDEACKNKNKNE